jgi:hypothetical protein
MGRRPAIRDDTGGLLTDVSYMLRSRLFVVLLTRR